MNNVKISSVAGAFFVPMFAVLAHAQTSLSPSEWRADLDQLVRVLEAEHPDPYTKISRDQFHERKDALAASVESLTDSQIIVGLMALVASIRDGHTTLIPSGNHGFQQWFPLSFYRFSDGIYITGANREHRDLVGTRVLEVGGTQAERAFQDQADLMGSDNEIGRSWNTFFLSSGDALAALGVIETAESMPLSVMTATGKIAKTKVSSLRVPGTLEWRFWGEMYSPIPDQRDGRIPLWEGSASEFSAIDPGDDRKATLPLHLKSRRAYWHEYLADQRTLYLHITHLTEAGRGSFDSFESFHREVFRLVEERAVDKFILDLRYASGGDGSVITPFLHEFIRSDKLREPGRLFTLVGRKTFSASVMLMDGLLEHTNTVLVGEPAGAPRNSFGDPGSFRLDHSNLTLQCSTVYWQLTNSKDTSRYQPIDLPAVFSGQEYFAGQDPAVDTILAMPTSFETIPQLFGNRELEVATAEYDRRKARFSPYEWWMPFDLHDMRMVARETLFSGGKHEAAFKAWQVCLEHYPDAWRGWRDYGKALLQVGESDRAKEALTEALRLNPGDSELQSLVRG